VDGGDGERLCSLAERCLIPGESSHNGAVPVTVEALVSALLASDQLGHQRL